MKDIILNLELHHRVILLYELHYIYLFKSIHIFDNSIQRKCSYNQFHTNIKFTVIQVI